MQGTIFLTENKEIQFFCGIKGLSTLFQMTSDINNAITDSQPYQ